MKDALITKRNSTLPGCYLFKSSKGKVLYVGKAKNLKKRVSQYFQHYKDLDPKIRRMLDEAEDVETVEVGSELEAFILEANLIKKYRPKYNAMFKDDKDYAWIVVTKDLFPKIYKARRLKIKSKDRWFGPYPSTTAINATLKFLRFLFPYRTCNLEIEEGIDPDRVKSSRRCLYYHMGLCDAPCDGLISKTDYRSNIRHVTLFLNSRKKHLIKQLESKMKNLSKRHRYEKAAKIRDQIEALEHISRKVYVEWGQDEYDIRKSNFQRARNGTKELIKTLRKHRLNLKKPTENYIDNFRVECYDISNVQGKQATGSMVVFLAGVMKKNHYRKFKIRIKDSPNDYAMMQEVFFRRFSRPKKRKKRDPSFSKLPKLIIVDGGKGQRNAAQKVLDEKTGVPDIPIIGLSKRKEEVWVKKQKDPVRFIEGSDAYFLLQRIRDEAHRFAITYHRKLRRRRLNRS